MRPPRASAILLWSGVQCAALLAATVGVRLWPHHPDPPESLALPELVATQMVAGSLLFPLIVPDVASLAVNLALSVSLLQLAGLLSAAPQTVVGSTTAFVGLWVGGLSGWCHLARGGLKGAWVMALACMLTVGGTMLWYVRAETAAQIGGPSPLPAAFGPLMAAVSLSAGANATDPVLGWTLASTPLVTSLGTLAWVARRPQHRRPPLFPTSTKNG